MVYKEMNFEECIEALKKRHPDWFKDDKTNSFQEKKVVPVPEVKKPVLEAPKADSVGLDAGDAEVVEDGDAIEVSDSDETGNWWDK